MSYRNDENFLGSYCDLPKQQLTTVGTSIDCKIIQRRQVSPNHEIIFWKTWTVALCRHLSENELGSIFASSTCPGYHNIFATASQIPFQIQISTFANNFWNLNVASSKWILLYRSKHSESQFHSPLKYVNPIRLPKRATQQRMVLWFQWDSVPKTGNDTLSENQHFFVLRFLGQNETRHSHSGHRKELWSNCHAWTRDSLHTRSWCCGIS